MPLYGIREQIINVLAASPAILCSGGTAYATGWPGYTREQSGASIYSNGTAAGVAIPSSGWINLFDRSYTKDSSNARPAVYIGSPGNAGTDSDDFTAISSGALIEYRIFKVDLVICASNPSPYVTEQMMYQLRANVKRILINNVVSTYWWEMRAPGIRGGGDLQERHKLSGTGGVGEIWEGIIVMPMRVRYQYNPADNLA